MIDWSTTNKFFVLLGALVLLVAGIVSLYRIPLDAIPDLSDTQVIIRTDYNGQAPQVIEDQVTFPLSTQMLGLPKQGLFAGFRCLERRLFISCLKMGLISIGHGVVCLNLYLKYVEFARGADPQLGPDATGWDGFFQYTLYDRTGQHDLADLRDIQDWFVRYELASVDGVAEIASVGGYQREYQSAG